MQCGSSQIQSIDGYEVSISKCRLIDNLKRKSPEDISEGIEVKSCKISNTMT